MFRNLRLGLSALYLISALALIAVVAGSTYRWLAYYFQTTTDLALQRRMARELRALGADLPAQLAAAESAWAASQNSLFPRPAQAAATLREGDSDHGEDHEEAQGAEDGEDHEETEEPEAGEPGGEEYFDGELASIFVLPLNAQAELAYDPNPYRLPMAPDLSSAESALAQGSDTRTVRLADGTRVRVLSYRVAGDPQVAVVQVGRALDGQDRILGQMLRGLLLLGGVSAVALGGASWWLAGRSLRPAQRAWERQQAFVANASHELRTPLTLLRASAEVALRGLIDQDTERRELLSDVLQECDHMSRLVEDLLLLSRLDAGRLALERQAVALEPLLLGVERQARRLAAEKGLQLLVNAAPNTEVQADPTRLRQILLILLDNALRHVPPGGLVQVKARRLGRQVEIEVADNGPGIAPEHQAHVFERFYRAGGPSREGGGSGLGLAIAKALVEAMRGQIRLESQTGAGTRVSILLAAGP
jgi:signal transduction histidine kinase